MSDIIYRVIDTAAKQLTKTAITVTAIFIVALGYDLWYYVLGYSGVIEYKMNTPLQKLGKLTYCCDLTFRAELGVIPIFEHLHVIEVLVHANAAIMFKDCKCSL